MARSGTNLLEAMGPRTRWSDAATSAMASGATSSTLVGIATSMGAETKLGEVT